MTKLLGARSSSTSTVDVDVDVVDASVDTGVDAMVSLLKVVHYRQKCTRWYLYHTILY
jgi:hypothetical protein